MRKWVTLGLVAVVTLGMAGYSFADVPSSLTSTVACTCVAGPGGAASTQLPYHCTISPANGTTHAEDIKVSVVVRNVLGSPLAGSTVNATATPVGASTFIWNPAQNPQSIVSDGSGNANFTFRRGGVATGSSPSFPNLDYSITAQGPGAGSPVGLNACSPQLNVKGYDENASGGVDLVDFALFSSDLGSGGARSDFNWSGATDLVDFALFSANLGTSITP